MLLNVNSYAFYNLPTVENPSCLQATLALVLLQESSQIVPQLLL